MENKKKTLREHGVEYTYDERFLPLTQKEMQLKGWEQPDFVYVIGDAYVDHPSFGPAIISRVLEAHGYKVAIISQPTGRMKIRLRFMAGRSLPFWCAPEIWIQW